MRFKLAHIIPGALLLAAFLTMPGTSLAAVEAVKGGVRFSYSDPLAGKVAVAGDFNGWNMTANPMTKQNGVWSTVVALGPGEHQYKFVIDDQWVADPENPVTAGDFGNSVVTLGADGKLVAMQATSNTELSPKIFLGSRYITLFDLRKDTSNANQWNLSRPQFDIDLDYTIRINDALTAHVLTNINNENQGVQLWETRLDFDRGSLDLNTEDIRVKAFDNDALGTFDDPLTLLGNVGIYGHDWGYNQQGVSFWKEYGGFQAQLVYSDDFRTGGTSGGSPLPLDLSTSAANPTARGVSYDFADSDNNKDVLGIRVKRPLRDGLTAGLSLRVDRGANPGTYIQGSASNDGGKDSTFFGSTVENWHAGGLDLQYENYAAGIDLHGEFLVGESYIRTGNGTRTLVTVNGDQINAANLNADPRDVRLDTSKRFNLGGRYYAYRGWHWEGSVDFEDHDFSDVATDSAQAVYNRRTTWNLGLTFSGEEWENWPWEAGLSLQIDDFAYGADLWENQFWFDLRNFWLEQGEHLVTVDRLTMLGGGNVYSWKPHASWTFDRGRNGTLGYRGIINSAGLDLEPRYWENNLLFSIDLANRLTFSTDTRFATYNTRTTVGGNTVFELDDTFISHFVEFKYRYTQYIEVALSWGVDPWVIDAVTNEYDHIGRDLFLFERGANGSVARGSYLDLGPNIRRAEEAMEDENRFQLEAIVRF